MRFVLVHGWGFGPSIFDPLIAELPQQAEIARVDLGFLGDEPHLPGWEDDAVAIGHSLGVMWLLKARPSSFRALVSIQGFDCFSSYVRSAKIAAMRKSLENDPYGLMQIFWRSCGTADVAPPDRLNQARLEEGLDWLMNWDETAVRQALTCPILALASKDDPIVPAKMSEVIWGERLKWSADAGHCLPLRHPAWCAEKITEFAAALPA